jgi:hypothetical protein
MAYTTLAEPRGYTADDQRQMVLPLGEWGDEMVLAKQPPHSCSGCSLRWDGLLTCHCTGCHRTFTGITACEKHRTGTHAKGRYCLDPAVVGLIDAGRKYACWANPGTYEYEDK